MLRSIAAFFGKTDFKFLDGYFYNFTNTINYCRAASCQLSLGEVEKYRTHNINELKQNVGNKVKLSGWVEHNRYNNRFIILRDTHSNVQVIGDKAQLYSDFCNFDLPYEIPLESVITVEGIVSLRSTRNITPFFNGSIEIVADSICILNENKVSAYAKYATDNYYSQDKAHDFSYDKLLHRYLYLRTKKLQENLKARSLFLHAVRNFFNIHHFIEIETPILYKPTITDVGAKEFLVPKCNLSALKDLMRNKEFNDFEFYALSQSPQILKQLLMVGGFDRYYQIAKCFRNENRIHNERQPEFTQIDLEMSFVSGSDIMNIIEDMLHQSYKFLVKDHLVKIPKIFQTIAYSEAMSVYGTDKPDFRYKQEYCLSNISNILENVDVGQLLEFFNFSASDQIDIIEIPLQHFEQFYQIKKYLHQEASSTFKIKVDDIFKSLMPTVYSAIFAIRRTRDGIIITPLYNIESSLKNVEHEIILKNNVVSIQSNSSIFSSNSNTTQISLCCFATDLKPCQIIMGKLRNLIIEHHFSIFASSLPIPLHKFEFLWVVDFPLFQKSKSATSFNPLPNGDITNRNNLGSLGLESVHHPFTAPISVDEGILRQIMHKYADINDSLDKIAYLNSVKSQLLALTAQHYDLVLNGVEIGGGSVRIHRPELQSFILHDILAPNHQRSKASQERGEFDFFIKALEAGCPPHAGIALGLDRLCSLARECSSIQDVIAFPKSSNARDVLADCPSKLF